MNIIHWYWELFPTFTFTWLWHSLQTHTNHMTSFPGHIKEGLGMRLRFYVCVYTCVCTCTLMHTHTDVLPSIWSMCSRGSCGKYHVQLQRGQWCAKLCQWSLPEQSCPRPVGVHGIHCECIGRKIGIFYMWVVQVKFKLYVTWLKFYWFTTMERLTGY